MRKINETNKVTKINTCKLTKCPIKEKSCDFNDLVVKKKISCKRETYVGEKSFLWGRHEEEDTSPQS